MFYRQITTECSQEYIKKIDKFYIFSHLNSAVIKKYEYNSNFVEYRLLYILLRTLSSDLVIKYLLADF